MLEECSDGLEVGPGVRACKEKSPCEVQPGSDNRAVAHHAEQQAGSGVHYGRLAGEEGLGGGAGGLVSADIRAKEVNRRRQGNGAVQAGRDWGGVGNLAGRTTRAHEPGKRFVPTLEHWG